jgi:hypothetical protein
MSAAAILSPGGGGRAAATLLVVAALLLSTLVLARDNPRLVITDEHGDLLSDEIYRQAEDWRKQPMFESEWRAPRKEDTGRMRFGYDSAYEAARAREVAASGDLGRDLQEPRPNTILRWTF